jgi:hypothetical protein
MPEMMESISDINRLRENLYSIIEQKSYNLNDPEVLEASECINRAIVNYNTTLKIKTV